MELSVLIPARNEKLLAQTVEDIINASSDSTEVVVGLDGYETELIKHPRVRVYQSTAPIGQRAMTNLLANYARGKYVLKTDAHCSYGIGFDKIMFEDADERTILAPYLMPLDGERWIPNFHKKTSRYCFDTKLVMQYDLENDEIVPETMCLQGSSWMVTRENYFKWGLGDESLGSWGSQGVELGIKAYLNGGVCKTTKKTYYAHVFRTSDTDFPYDRGKEPGKQSNELVRQRYMKLIGGLVEKFNYPADWTPEKILELCT